MTPGRFRRLGISSTWLFACRSLARVANGPVSWISRTRFTADARRFALERRVLLVESSAGVALDISLAGLPFEERVVARSSAFAFAPDVSLVTRSAEDLVILKAFAGRVQDWMDVEGIIVRQGARLDRALVLEELRPLLDLKRGCGGRAHTPAIVQQAPALRCEGRGPAFRF